MENAEDGAEEEDGDRLNKSQGSLPRAVLSSRRSLYLLVALLLLLVVVAAVVWLLTVTSPSILASPDQTPEATCVPLRIPLCYRYKVPYSRTLGEISQGEIVDLVSRFEPIVSVNCYHLLPLYLCTLYAPKCEPGGVTVPPCRSLCEETRRHCDFFLGVFSLTWPSDQACEDLPDSRDPSMCVGHNDTEVVRKAQRACASGLQCDHPRRCLHSNWRCDGITDCEDLSDETNCGGCGEGEVYCGGPPGCLPADRRCDGKPDCPDARDEARCLRLGPEARLETYAGRVWQPVCADAWSPNRSSGACRELGYRGSAHTELRRLEPARTRVAGRPRSSRPTCSSESSVHVNCRGYDCGKAPLYPQARIVGGLESSPGRWPWMVALHGGPMEVFFCGGTLLSDWWVLSAAHCIGNQTELGGWTLKLGMTRRPAAGAVVRGVAEIVRYPEFVDLYSNDLALLRLDRPVPLGDLVRPACLPPPPGTWKRSMEELRCIVAGWGKALHDDEAEYLPVLHEVQVPVVKSQICAEWYSAQGFTISDRMLCAGFPEGRKDACQGDSGGPLLCQFSNRWAVTGVVSWGIKCAQPNLPGIYTNVQMYVSWILNATAERGYPLEH